MSVGEELGGLCLVVVVVVEQYRGLRTRMG